MILSSEKDFYSVMRTYKNIFPIKHVRIIRHFVFLLFFVGIRHPSIITVICTHKLENCLTSDIGKIQKVAGSPLVLDILQFKPRLYFKCKLAKHFQNSCLGNEQAFTVLIKFYF